MPIQQTFAMIKPDAVKKGHAGAILTMIEEAGFKVRAMRAIHMTRKQAEGFYAVHRERPFFGSLVKFMSGGPTVVMILEREGAIKAWRRLMGATDPAEAAEGTIRKLYASSIERNAVHGSDAVGTARVETAYFFSEVDKV